MQSKQFVLPLAMFSERLNFRYISCQDQYINDVKKNTTWTWSFAFKTINFTALSLQSNHHNELKNSVYGNMGRQVLLFFDKLIHAFQALTNSFLAEEILLKL